MSLQQKLTEEFKTTQNPASLKDYLKQVYQSLATKSPLEQRQLLTETISYLKRHHSFRCLFNLYSKLASILEPKEAITQYQQALSYAQHDSPIGETFLTLSQLHLGLNNLDEAMKSINNCIEFVTSKCLTQLGIEKFSNLRLRALYQKGLVLEQLSKPGQAVIEYQKGVKLCGSDSIMLKTFTTKINQMKVAPAPMRQVRPKKLKTHRSNKDEEMRLAMVGDLNCSYPIYRDRKIGQWRRSQAPLSTKNLQDSKYMAKLRAESKYQRVVCKVGPSCRKHSWDKRSPIKKVCTRGVNCVNHDWSEVDKKDSPFKQVCKKGPECDNHDWGRRSPIQSTFKERPVSVQVAATMPQPVVQNTIGCDGHMHLVEMASRQQMMSMRMLQEEQFKMLEMLMQKKQCCSAPQMTPYTTGPTETLLLSTVFDSNALQVVVKQDPYPYKVKLVTDYKDYSIRVANVSLDQLYSLVTSVLPQCSSLKELKKRLKQSI